MHKVQYIAINSIELPKDIIEEFRLFYEDYPMILELNSRIKEN